uniref:Uncharacterized protein n=1 Tax=Arundo donax TaxID=35708 RepID=A0A0A9AFN6_ARUDO
MEDFLTSKYAICKILDYSCTFISATGFFLLIN